MSGQRPGQPRRHLDTSSLADIVAVDQRAKQDRCEALLATGANAVTTLRTATTGTLDSLDVLRSVTAFSEAVEALAASGQIEGSRLRDLRALVERVDPEVPASVPIGDYIALIVDRLAEVGIDVSAAAGTV